MKLKGISHVDQEKPHSGKKKKNPSGHSNVYMTESKVHSFPLLRICDQNCFCIWLFFYWEVQCHPLYYSHRLKTYWRRSSFSWVVDFLQPSCFLAFASCFWRAKYWMPCHFRVLNFQFLKWGSYFSFVTLDFFNYFISFPTFKVMMFCKKHFISKLLC